MYRENKDADQLRGYREADLPFFFGFPYAKCWYSHNAAQIEPQMITFK